MDDQKLIGVRHVEAGDRRIPVLLFRNGSSSVAARCLINPGDTPILDGPTPEAVLELVALVIEDLLLARGAGRAVSPELKRVRRAAEDGGAGRQPGR